MFKLPVFFIFALIGFAQITFARTPHFSDYSQIFKNGRIVGNGLFKEKSPSIEEIEALIPQLESDTDFFDYLRVKFPHFKDNVVLVHRTESQQLSSLKNPRIILFGGGTAFTFSEEPTQKARKVEMLFTNPQTYEISLAEISFENNKAALHRNPKSCVACHGSPARPLWNPYDFWPNTFGSAIGYIGTTAEMKAYEKLLNRASKSPILKHLNLPKNLNPKTEAVSAFTQYVSKLNMGRWIRLNLTKGSSFDQYAKPLIAAVEMCLAQIEGSSLEPLDFKKIRNYIKVSDISPYNSLLTDIVHDQKNSRAHFKKYLDSVLVDIFPIPQYVLRVDHYRLNLETDRQAVMRWILAMSGVDVQDISTSLIGNDSLLSTPSDFSLEFLSSVYELRPDLFTGVRYSMSELVPGKLAYMRIDCKSLSRASLADTRTASEEIIFKFYTEDIANRPAISRCSKCHVEHIGDALISAPTIPLDDPMRLAETLRAPDSSLRTKIERRLYSTGLGQKFIVFSGKSRQQFT